MRLTDKNLKIYAKKNLNVKMEGIQIQITANNVNVQKVLVEHIVIKLHIHVRLPYTQKYSNPKFFFLSKWNL